MNTKLAATALLSLLSLSGCGSAGSSVPAGVTAAQALDCRKRTDEVFLQQHGGELYKADSFVAGTRDSPLSGSTSQAFGVSLGAPIYSQGLSGEFARSRALNDCYNAAIPPAGAVAAPAAKP